MEGLEKMSAKLFDAQIVKKAILQNEVAECAFLEHSWSLAEEEVADLVVWEFREFATVSEFDLFA